MSRTQIDSSLVPSALSSSQNINNILINGGMEFWQRGTSFSSPADSTVQADRWTHYQNGSPTYTVTQENGAGNVDSGQYSFKLNITAVGGSTSFQYRQYVEDYFPYLGKSVSLSMRIKSNAAIKIAIYDGITFTTSNAHSGGGSFETLSVTATVSSSANQLSAIFGFGTNATGTPLVSTSYIDAGMMVNGSVALSFVAKNYEDELAQCMRYFQTAKFDGNRINPLWYQNPNDYFYYCIYFLVPMRAIPTMTFNGGSNIATTLYAFPTQTTNSTAGSTLSFSYPGGGSTTYSSMYSSNTHQTTYSMFTVDNTVSWTANAELI